MATKAARSSPCRLLAGRLALLGIALLAVLIVILDRDGARKKSSTSTSTYAMITFALIIAMIMLCLFTSVCPLLFLVALIGASN